MLHECSPLALKAGCPELCRCNCLHMCKSACVCLRRHAPRVVSQLFTCPHFPSYSTWQLPRQLEGGAASAAHAHARLSDGCSSTHYGWCSRSRTCGHCCHSPCAATASSSCQSSAQPGGFCQHVCLHTHSHVGRGMSRDILLLPQYFKADNCCALDAVREQVVRRRCSATVSSQSSQCGWQRR